MATPLTKADTRALWHAVDDMRLLTYSMAEAGCTVEQIAARKALLRVAKRALRKVNAIRKEARDVAG